MLGVGHTTTSVESGAGKWHTMTHGGGGYGFEWNAEENLCCAVFLICRTV